MAIPVVYQGDHALVLDKLRGTGDGREAGARETVLAFSVNENGLVGAFCLESEATACCFTAFSPFYAARCVASAFGGAAEARTYPP